MQDQRWIRNLAKATYAKGQWVSDDSADSVHQTTEVEDIIGELLQEAIEAAEVFNHYSQGRRTLKILPLHVESQLQTTGFLLLLGRTQIRIQQSGKTIEAMLTLMRGYQMKTALLHKFTPLVDSF